MTTTMNATSSSILVRLANYSNTPFSGWIRRTIDVLPPHPAGELRFGLFARRARYVVGRRVGRSTWIVDLWLEQLDRDEEVSFDLHGFDAWQFGLPPAKPNPVAFFGGMPTVNGVQLQLREAKQDGAGMSLRFAARLPGLLHVEFWCLWRPDEPGLVHGEVVVCAANPASTNVVESTPDLRLSWGDALVHVPGAGWGTPIVPATWFADGAARGVPITLVWPRNFAGEWLAMVAAVNRSTCGTGLQQLLPFGNPRLPVGFDGKAWTTGLYAESLRRLHTWEPAMLGPNMRSSDTGAQEDQVFVRGEVFDSRGLGAEEVAYFAALKLLARPCHHLLEDGSIADPRTAVPILRYWDGYAFGNPVVNPYGLFGKPRTPSLEESHGWSGPDVEHWLINTLAAAARYTGSHALQWELRNQAHVYFGQQTTNPGWSTSQPWASRAVGWEAIAAVRLFECLEDRSLAARVVAHWGSRWSDVIWPAYGENEIVDIRVDDSRLGPGAWWMPWQQSVAAYGLDLAGQWLAVPGARVCALRLAKAVLQHAWAKINGRWCTAPVAPVPSAMAMTADNVSAPIDVSKARRFVHEETGVKVFPHAAAVVAALAADITEWQPTLFDEAFNLFGMPLAIAVVLRHEPDNETAREIWQQCVADNRGHSWLAPGIEVAQ